MKYVYLAKAGNDYKVGIANNVTKRIGGIQTSNATKIEVVMTRLVDDAYYIEQATYGFMDKMKSGGGTEWFTLTPEEAIELAIHICKNPEINIAEEITVRQLLNRQNEIQRKLNTKLSQALLRYKVVPKAEIETVVIPADIPEEAKRVVTHQPSPIDDDDQLKLWAMEIFKFEGKASTSLLQRKLRIGYGKASRILDLLEADGKISPWNGQAVRQVI